MLKKIFRIKSADGVVLATETAEVKLHKSIGRFELVALGIGAIIGAGIFVITGTAASGDINAAGEIIRFPAGPAITLSFVITAVGCCFCALCYAELASMIPVSGSAYTYSYVGMGEIFAWIIGWCLLLEYTFDAATVSIGWSGYFEQLIEKVFGINFPDWLVTPTMVSLKNQAAYASYPHLFGYPLSLNLPAMLVIGCLTTLLVRGIRESTRFNSFVVILKLIVVFICIFVGAYYVKPENWAPFMPYGMKGVMSGASLIFFAYIGFDALSTTTEEVKDIKYIPFGIIGSLIVCTILYIVVAGILTGMTPYSMLNTPEPVATAFNYVGQNFLASYIVSVGAVIALLSTLLVFLLGQPRIIFSMARDGFFPKGLAKIHPKRRTPHRATIISGIIIMLLAGFGDLTSVAALCNAGTLTAFMVVCLSVIILRYKKPDEPRKFKVPFVPLIPILGIIVCGALFAALPTGAHITFVIWTVIGLVLYFSYGIRHTKY